ncbi:MAG: hypothetical protein JWO13_2727 [Acidobacteriales bacterium]|nr:hypothetical protein [Terriglobales bacterium]
MSDKPQAPIISRAPQPISPVRGGGYVSSPSKPTRIPPDIPVLFNKHPSASTILNRAIREFADQSLMAQMIKAIIARLMPGMVDLVDAHIATPTNAEQAMDKLVWSLVVYNDPSNDHHPRKDELLRSNEWLQFIEQIHQGPGIRELKANLSLADEVLKDALCKRVRLDPEGYIVELRFVSEAITAWKQQSKAAVNSALAKEVQHATEGGIKTSIADVTAKGRVRLALEDNLRCKNGWDAAVKTCESLEIEALLSSEPLFAQADKEVLAAPIIALALREPAISKPETKQTKAALIFKSELKRAICVVLTKKPQASALEICRMLDDDGIECRWKVGQERQFDTAYKSTEHRGKINSIIAKVRNKMRANKLLD